MESEREVTTLSRSEFTEGLVNSFALYHSVGMSYEDYWHGPFDLILRYNVLLNKHEESKIEQAWLHGYTTYLAIGTALDGKPYPKLSEFLNNGDTETKRDVDIEREARKSEALIHQLMGQYGAKTMSKGMR